MNSAPDICRALCATLMAVFVSLTASIAGAQSEGVRVVIYQAYEFRDPLRTNYQPIRNFDLPVLSIVEDMIFAIGGDVVDGADTDSHLPEIKVTINGRALGMRYHEWQGRYYYTGAQIYGSVLLTTQYNGSYYRSFSSLTPAPLSLGDFDPGYDKPYHAPFLATVNELDGLSRAITEVMADAWGIKAIVPLAFEAGETARSDVVNLLGEFGDPVVVPDLIAVLETDANSIVRWQAAWSLGRIGDERAVSHLIESLNDPSQDVRWFAGWSLREITGESFGPDYDAWSDWRAQQDVPAEG